MDIQHERHDLCYRYESCGGKKEEEEENENK